MKINWRVRIVSKVFWVALIPAVLFLCAKVLTLFGITFDYTALQALLLEVVGAVFGLLLVLGVVVDPTTVGMSDSERVLKKTKEDEKNGKSGS